MAPLYKRTVERTLQAELAVKRLARNPLPQQTKHSIDVFLERAQKRYGKSREYALGLGYRRWYQMVGYRMICR